MHVLVHCWTFLLIPGHMYLVVTKCCVAWIPGCESEWSCSKIIRHNWAGTTGRMVPVDVSHVSKFPELESEMSLSFKEFEPNWSSDSSGSSRWAITNCSKSIPWDETWETSCKCNRASAAWFVLPWTWRISDVNWDIKSRCRICLGECRLEDDDRDYIRGLWLVRTENWRSSRMCRKCVMSRYIASSSRSKVLYRVSAGLSFLEKYAIGHRSSWTNCCSTAPTTMSKVSVMMLVGAFMTGCERSMALARASLASVRVQGSVLPYKFLFLSHWSSQQIVERL